MATKVITSKNNPMRMGKSSACESATKSAPLAGPKSTRKANNTKNNSAQPMPSGSYKKK